MHAPGTFASAKVPFANILGQTHAVTLSMFMFGGLLWKLGHIILERKWHETTLGLWCICGGGLLTCVLLAML